MTKGRKKVVNEKDTTAIDEKFEKLYEVYEDTEFDLQRAVRAADEARHHLRDLQKYKREYANTMTKDVIDCLKDGVSIEIMLAKVLKYQGSTDLIRRLDEAHHSLSQEIQLLEVKRNKARQDIEDYSN